jgi:glutamyl-tRNA reductase
LSVVLLGVDHHTASVALRERLALSGCALRSALEDLRATLETNAQEQIAVESAFLKAFG